MQRLFANKLIHYTVNKKNKNAKMNLSLLK